VSLSILIDSSIWYGFVLFTFMWFEEAIPPLSCCKREGRRKHH
jgi:hypothetical protein